MVSGAVAFIFLNSWMWGLDRAYPKALADAGRGLQLPSYLNDNRSVGWWAMAVLLIADASLKLSIAFAYLFLWTAKPSIWPLDGSQTPRLIEPVVLLGLTAGAYLLFETAERFNRRDARFTSGLCLAGTAILAGVAIAAWATLQPGLRAPSTSSLETRCGLTISSKDHSCEPLRITWSH
jgi:cytochrome c oxidase subunit I+III